MASAELRTAARETWVLANPWTWVLVGLGLCALVLVLVAFPVDILGPRLESFEAVRVSLVFLGLLCAGGGITIRLNCAQAVFVEHPDRRTFLVYALAGLFALMALITTCLFLFRVVGLEFLSWKPGQTLFLWLLVAPVSAVGCYQCVTRLRPGSVFTRGDETAALLVLVALAAFCGCWALYDAQDPGAWDSMRLFVAFLALVALVAAPHCTVGPGLLRLFVSLQIVLHFGGIFAAVLSAPPTPWLVGQVWTRLYRPYLEFMYLNNAYHFYAPEPGPASHLWFRLFYEAPDGQVYATWHKIPDVDERGRPRTIVSLEYQRILALTENTVPTDPTPPTTVYDASVKANVPAAWIALRLLNSPQPAGPIIGGQGPVKDKQVRMRVPFHPYITPETNQYLQPTSQSRKLLMSYARHVCRMPHPEHKDWKIQGVKVYRAVHMIPPIEYFAKGFNDKGIDPNDPELYRPYFMGHYDPQGKLIDEEDPFLYWLLPILRDKQEKTSFIRNYALKHAGDPNWIHVWVENRWEMREGN